MQGLIGAASLLKEILYRHSTGLTAEIGDERETIKHGGAHAWRSPTFDSPVCDQPIPQRRVCDGHLTSADRTRDQLWPKSPA
jgi:hypothetical protein